MINALESPFLQELGAGAAKLGHELYIVGGYVRNKLLQQFNQQNSKTKLDLDLVINTNAIEFIHKFQKYYEDSHPQHLSFEIVEEFKGFGTIKISHPEYPELAIELASTRTEIYEEPATFPKVFIINDIKEDLHRRDFTINAILESLIPKNFGEVIDYVNGIHDLKQGLIRAFHSQSFIDDPTRIYRAARFAAEYDFQIETNTLSYIRAALNHQDFELWYKKRKSRFDIELEKIHALTENKSEKALAFIESFSY